MVSPYKLFKLMFVYFKFSKLNIHVREYLKPMEVQFISSLFLVFIKLNLVLLHMFVSVNGVSVSADQLACTLHWILIDLIHA